MWTVDPFRPDASGDLHFLISFEMQIKRNLSEVARSWPARMSSVTPCIVVTMYCCNYVLLLALYTALRVLLLVAYAALSSAPPLVAPHSGSPCRRAKPGGSRHAAAIQAALASPLWKRGKIP